MTGIETQVLRVVQGLGAAPQGSIARKMGVSDDYIIKICQNLVEDGYLNFNSDGKYKLTRKSNRELSPVKSHGPIAILKGGI